MAAGQTWMVFGLAAEGEGMNADLMARAEMPIGEVDSLEGIPYAMHRHYTNTQPFYAICPIQDRPFLS